MEKKKLFTLIIALATLGSAYAQWGADENLVPFRQGPKWGFSDAGKNIVIPAKYNDADWFYNGMAAVKIGTKWGYINKAGKLIIPARYTVAKPFRKGYMPTPGGDDSLLFAGVSTRSDGYETCINAKGVQLKGCPAIPENSVASNRGPVKQVHIRKSYTLPGSEGLFDKITDDFKIPDSTETYYVAVKGGKYGVMNSKFQTIVPFEFDGIKVDNYEKAYLELQKGGMAGLGTGAGKTFIPMDYTAVSPVQTSNGTEYVIVKKSGMAYLKDMKNGDVMPRSYYDIVYDPTYDGFILTGDQNLKGYYFLNNKVIEPKYRSIEILPGGKYMRVKTSDGGDGIINIDGKEYF